jgi:futalosine hydrolase
MNVLVVAATEEELESVRKKTEGSQIKDVRLEFLVTGVGSKATTYSMVKKITSHRFDLAINIGLAGTFRDEIQIGEVVAVVSDQFADLGAEDQDKFLSAFDIGLIPRDRFPFWNGKLKCDGIEKFTLLGEFKKVKAITVNTVHGHDRTIQRTMSKFHPDVESMEGAAFHYVCMLEKIPGIQIRAISNRVERRNRESWDIELAIQNLSSATIRFLKQLK